MRRSYDVLGRARRLVSARLALRAGVAAALTAVGAVALGDYQQQVVVTALIYGIAAISLTVLMGWVGRPSLMTAGSLLAGGYCTVFVAGRMAVPFPATLVVVTLVGAVFGLAASLPARRLSGLYLLLSTLAVFYLVVDLGNIVQSRQAVLGGYFVDPPQLFGYALTDGSAWFLVVALLTFGVYEYFTYIRRTRHGRAWIAIRDHEAAASVTGVRVGSSVALAFALTTAVQFLAGALLAYHLSTVSYTAYTLQMSFNFIVMIVLGGLGRPLGAVAGAAVVTLVPTFMNSLFGGAATTDSWMSRNLGSVESIVFALIGTAVLLRARRTRPRRTRKDTAAAPSPQAPTGTPAKASPTGTPEEVSRTELVGVSASYAAGETALDDVTLTVAAGATTAVVGRNGAGKSSLLHALAGYPEQSGGRVVSGQVRLRHDGEETDLRPLSISERSDLGVALIPAEDKVFAELTVREHLREAIAAGTARARRTGAEAPAMATLLESFPALGDKLDRRAGLLSGGERQQLALAAAVARLPHLLLIDEPTLGLSPAAIAMLEPVLGRIRSQVPGGIVLAEQNPSLAMRLADTLVLLENGRPVRSGEPSDELLEFIENRFLGLDELVAAATVPQPDGPRAQGVTQ
ncbi:ABC transporter permease subunit [Streptomyces abyssomicinicus]|uniref:ABC transporter permease subunit n=1 Tax=Streptomyces abyssomicinicus TaxID=574929 RepID=UPI0013E06AD2|nr:ATP-binding cassette domain-containing protein [Streptomyces abyssomicinicus]